MSDRHTSNDAEPAWERRNAGRERLKALADSINDTARMTRATLSLLLVVALYLGFTLVSSTDENLILDAEVAVLQVGSGIALKQSYIFGPWIFLYLHLQALFLLSILHRKMEKFNTALHSELRNLQSERQEHWDWLSAFAFVQRLRPDHRLRLFSRFLMWISTEALPLILLFIVTLSFVRYQSEWITWGHKFVFVLDLTSVIMFKRRVLGQFRCTPPGHSRQVAFPSAIVTLRIAVAAMTLVLLIWAKPPTFDLASYEENSEALWKVMKEKRSLVWRPDASDQEMSQESIRHTNADGQQSTSMEKVRRSIRLAHKDSRVWENNVLDAGPCEWLGFACRYLDARNLWLVTSRADYVSIPGIGGVIDANTEETQWFRINKLSLSERNLRFADFGYAELQGVNLSSAQLQGANLEGANLQDALLERADMHGAFLFTADLQDAVLSNADLAGANLGRAGLQRAKLDKAQLQSVSLKEAELQSASLVGANLRYADMESARLDDASLQGADLKNAQLKDAWLWGAALNDVELEGANLRGAKLEGANLRNAKLPGTCLEGAQLEGVDLSDANIQDSRGTPDSWDLAWPPRALEYDSNKPDFASEELDEAAEQEWKLFMNELNKFPPDKIPVPSGYWVKLANWTTEFTCKNKYTVRSSWNRWSHDDPLGGMKKLVDEETIVQVKRRILQLILGGQGCEECAGLRDISDEQRKRWRRELVEIGSAISWMHGVFDAHPVCWEQRYPKSTEERPVPPPLQRRCPTYPSPIQEIRP